jgi:hypothetical protein
MFGLSVFLSKKNCEEIENECNIALVLKTKKGRRGEKV